jgi:hypothetical protein
MANWGDGAEMGTELLPRARICIDAKPGPNALQRRQPSDI